MNSSELGDFSQIENPEKFIESLITFERVQNVIMRIKNNFMRETLLKVLDKSEDIGLLKKVAILGSSFLLKEQKETEQFMERVKKGEVTVGEVIEFRNKRIYAIYCPLCLEEIEKEQKLIRCSPCKEIYHEKCFRDEFINDDKCSECKN